MVMFVSQYGLIQINKWIIYFYKMFKFSAIICNQKSVISLSKTENVILHLID